MSVIRNSEDVCYSGSGNVIRSSMNILISALGDVRFVEVVSYQVMEVRPHYKPLTNIDVGSNFIWEAKPLAKANIGCHAILY